MTIEQRLRQHADGYDSILLDNALRICGEHVADIERDIAELRDDPHIQRFGGETLAQKIHNALCDIHTRVNCLTCPTMHRSRDLRDGRCIDCWWMESKTPTPEARDE